MKDTLALQIREIAARILECDSSKTDDYCMLAGLIYEKSLALKRVEFEQSLNQALGDAGRGKVSDVEAFIRGTEHVPSSLNERTEPVPSSLNERTEPVPSSLNERTEPVPSSLNERTEPVPSSLNERTEPVPFSLNERTEPVPSSLNENVRTESESIPMGKPNGENTSVKTEELYNQSMGCTSSELIESSLLITGECRRRTTTMPILDEFIGYDPERSDLFIPKKKKEQVQIVDDFLGKTAGDTDIKVGEEPLTQEIEPLTRQQAETVYDTSVIVEEMEEIIVEETFEPSDPAQGVSMRGVEMEDTVGIEEPSAREVVAEVSSVQEVRHSESVAEPIVTGPEISDQTDDKTSAANYSVGYKYVYSDPSHTLNTVLSEAQPIVLNNAFKMDKHSLNDILRRDIRIGLNDRIVMVKHLFGGNHAALDAAIVKLNSLDDAASALAYVEEELKAAHGNWDGCEVIEKRFMELIGMRFDFE